MARIRTIKPEFPLSESVGQLSRDARLLFIQIWTVCDDEGRTRASSRVLASLLYPFDEDARGLIDGWVSELVRAELVTLYRHEGTTYLEVKNWRKHQKIDRPTPSRLPPIEGSRVLVEPSRVLDALPRTLDLGCRSSDATHLPASPPPGPLDLKKELFTRGASFLKASGMSDTKARQLLGMWRKSYGDLATINALAAAEGAAVSDPVPYITQALKDSPRGQSTPSVVSSVQSLLNLADQADPDENVF